MTQPTEHAPTEATRTMTPEEFTSEWSTRSLDDMLLDGSITIIARRPDFGDMTIQDVALWIYRKLDMQEGQDFFDETVERANAIADRLNLAPVRNGATSDE